MRSQHDAAHSCPPPPHPCLPPTSAPPLQAKEILTSALPVHAEVQRTHVDAVLNLVARNKVRGGDHEGGGLKGEGWRWGWGLGEGEGGKG